MFKFYLPLNRESFKTNFAYKTFLSGAVNVYRTDLLNLLDKEKCDRYDSLLLKFSNIKNIENMASKPHFTYNLLRYLISQIRCYKGDFRGVLFYFNIGLNNPFGSIRDVDKVFRLIEYGNGNEIPPYNLFNRGLVVFRKHIMERFWKNRR